MSSHHKPHKPHKSQDRQKLQPQRRLTIILEDMDLSWYPDEIGRFLEMWKSGAPLLEMAAVFDRDPDEVLLLVIDQVRGKHIAARPGGYLGSRAKTA